MRRWIAFLLALAMLGLSACSLRQTPLEPVQFYYRNAVLDYTRDRSPLAPELRDLADTGDDLAEQLRLYFSGPLDPGFQSPFPKNLELLGCTVSDDTLTLNLSSVFAELSGVDLEMACACAALTGMELTGTDCVSFLVDGQEKALIHREDLLLYDNSLEQLRRSVTLYYTDETGRFLLPQIVSVAQNELSETCLEMVNELQKAPKGLVSPLPAGFRVLDLSINRRVCTVNLAPGFQTNPNTDPIAQRLFLLSITNTLTQLDEISSVEFAVNGVRMFHYGAISTSEAFVWEEGAIGPVRSGVNESDVTLYMESTKDSRLLPIPTALRMSTGSSMADQVLEALLEAPAGNGCRNPIPAGTTLEDIRLADGGCYLLLGGTLLTEGRASAETAVHAIVATLTELSDIDWVQIAPADSYSTELSDLFSANLTVSDGWIAG